MLLASLTAVVANLKASLPPALAASLMTATLLAELEATAAAIIRSRALGPISAMGSEVIQELLGAFPGL